MATGRIAGALLIGRPKDARHGSVHTAAGCLIASEAGAGVIDLDTGGEWRLSMAFNTSLSGYPSTINAKTLELSRDHWLGDQTALEALVRFSDGELKHQELFRRVEKLAAEKMPPGLSVRVATGSGSRGGAGQKHLGRAGADVAHRAVHANALPAEHPHFIKTLTSMITDAQAERIQSALTLLT